MSRFFSHVPELFEMLLRLLASYSKKWIFSLKVNREKKALGANRTPEARAQRNQQFEYINCLRAHFAEEGDPSISVDSKKKEMVGDFKNNNLMGT